MCTKLAPASITLHWDQYFSYNVEGKYNQALPRLITQKIVPLLIFELQIIILIIQIYSVNQTVLVTRSL